MRKLLALIKQKLKTNSGITLVIIISQLMSYLLLLLTLLL